ncbi:MAG: hypothetical protein OEX08_02430 [Candidatus Nomurabacteria bacterium]|nr:hypothetical protein [Candidatus Nomurabacteria bacterium]
MANTTVAQVVRNKNENSMNLLRRFRKAVRNADFTQMLKGNRYFARKASDLRRKEGAMARIRNGKKYKKMWKLGKVEEKQYGRR